jgi:NCAIR mutase (PurE)-related protein
MIRLVKIAVAYVVGYGVGFIGLLALLAVVGILTACTLI